MLTVDEFVSLSHHRYEIIMIIHFDCIVCSVVHNYNTLNTIQWLGSIHNNSALPLTCIVTVCDSLTVRVTVNVETKLENLRLSLGR